MIERIAIVGQRMELDDDLKRYVNKKIGRLDRYAPRHARESMHAEVKLRDANKRHGNKYECEVLLHLPAVTLTAVDSTMNAYAAVDIVEQKLKNQLKRYKDVRQEHGRQGGIVGRFKRRLGQPVPPSANESNQSDRRWLRPLKKDGRTGILSGSLPK